jgi:hypothetical protein
MKKKIKLKNLTDMTGKNIEIEIWLLLHFKLASLS